MGTVVSQYLEGVRITDALFTSLLETPPDLLGGIFNPAGKAGMKGDPASLYAGEPLAHAKRASSGAKETPGDRREPGEDVINKFTI